MDNTFNIGAIIVTTILLTLFWGIIACGIYMIKKGIKKMQDKHADKNDYIAPEIDDNVKQRMEETGRNKYYGEERVQEKLIFPCPVCSNEIKTSFSAKGDVVLCKNCKNKIIIPENAVILK